MHIDTVFSIHQVVRVKELNVRGRVRSILIGPGYYMYAVRYFDDDRKAEEIYFYEEELEQIPND